jgi:succinyl-CoA synthetase alpha subunit
MSILAFKNTSILIQGITGGAARHHTENMLAYGSNIVAGARPGAAGQFVHGVPVYDSVADACSEHHIDASILFIPGRAVKDSALEALRSGIRLLVIVTEHVPLHDAMAIMEEKTRRGAIIIGPNTPGMISPPEETMLGFVPGRYFIPGPIGVASRSGTLTYEFVSRLTAAGIGQSTCIGVGGDRLVGLRFGDALKLFEEDDGTEGVLLVGEIGGTMEEEAAELVGTGKIKKPVFAYVAGHTAPEGTKVGHAGAIVHGARGTMKSKVDALTGAGIHFARRPAETIELVKKVLGKR